MIKISKITEEIINVFSRHVVSCPPAANILANILIIIMIKSKIEKGATGRER